jgi:hypothetical protein
MDYWLSGNAPVIVALSRPAEDLAWWFDVPRSSPTPAATPSAPSPSAITSSPSTSKPPPRSCTPPSPCGYGIYLAAPPKIEILTTTCCQCRPARPDLALMPARRRRSKWLPPRWPRFWTVPAARDEHGRGRPALPDPRRGRTGRSRRGKRMPLPSAYTARKVAAVQRQAELKHAGLGLRLGRRAPLQHGHVGQDARGGAEVGLVADQRRRPLVGGDADVLEDERAEQEVVLAGVDVEGLPWLDQPGRRRGRGEAVPDVDRRPGYHRAAQGLAQELHVVVLVAGDPNPVVAESLLDRLIDNSHQVFMNGPSYRPNKRPGQRVTTTATEPAK